MNRASSGHQLLSRHISKFVVATEVFNQELHTWHLHPTTANRAAPYGWLTVTLAQMVVEFILKPVSIRASFDTADGGAIVGDDSGVLLLVLSEVSSVYIAFSAIRGVAMKPLVGCLCRGLIRRLALCAESMSGV